ETDVAQRALAGLEVTSTPSEVCLYAADGTKLDCFGSQPEADAAKQAIQVLPQSSTTPSGSASASASASSTASASPSESGSPGVGPSPAAASYCLTDSNGNQLVCYPTQDEANKQKQGITSKVTKNTWCIAPTPPPPTPTPSPTASPTATPSKGPSKAKAKATATPSAPGSASGTS